jgi:hypothetical protein
MEQIEPVEKKICRACGIEKQISKFPSLTSGNRAGVCRICKATGRNIPKEKIGRKEPKKNNPLQLGNISIKDYENTYRFLESIGYSLKKDLHEQFCKKYGLTPSSPKQEFNNYYSPKDLGLV